MSAEGENLEGVPKPGETIAGTYEVEAVVGAGGMGVVLAARHVALGPWPFGLGARSAVSREKSRP